jgi:hypothetical protein
MTDRADDGILEIADRVLGDLRLRDRMFTARRPDPTRPGVIVIQTGEEGRHAVTAPNLDQPGSVETFIAAAQAHLREIYGQPVPLCPAHDHALVGQVTSSTIEWACPDGAWSCLLGDYEESTWPTGLTSGHLAAALCARLERRGVAGVRRVGCVERDGQWIAQLGIWPMSQPVIDAVANAAAPIQIEVEPCQDVLIRVADTTSPDQEGGTIAEHAGFPDI